MTIFHVLQYSVYSEPGDYNRLPLWVRSRFLYWLEDRESNGRRHKFLSERKQKLRELLLEYDPDIHDYQ